MNQSTTQAAKNCVMCKLPMGVSKSSYCNACFNVTLKMAKTVRHVVQIAIKAGDLPPPTTLACADCGEPAYCYDHRDYGKALDVEPVCRSCNRRRGPAERFGKWGADRVEAVHSDEIVRLHKAKWSLREIGHMFELSYERVRQILQDQKIKGAK